MMFKMIFLFIKNNNILLLYYRIIEYYFIIELLYLKLYMPYLKFLLNYIIEIILLKIINYIIEIT